jgi:hypothetical protein
MSENNGKIVGVNSKKSLIAEERHPRKVGTDVVVRRAFNVSADKRYEQWNTDAAKLLG